MTILETDRLILRPWQEHDRDLFFEINSDPAVMEFFPFRRTRQEADAFLDTLMREQRERVVFAAAELRDTGECIGFCGLHDGDVEPAFPRRHDRDRLAAGRAPLGQGLRDRGRAVRRSNTASAALGLPRDRLLRGPRQPPLDRGDGAHRHDTRSGVRFRPPACSGHASGSETPRRLPHDGGRNGATKKAAV